MHERLYAAARALPDRLRLATGDVRVSGVARNGMVHSSLIKRMARITSGYSREVGLYRHIDGTHYLRLGLRREVSFGGPGIAAPVAHTHYTGHVYLSVPDVRVLNIFEASTHTVISGSGDIVKRFDVPDMSAVMTGAIPGYHPFKY